MPDEKVKILFLQVNNPGIVFYRMYQFAQRMSELNLAHSVMFPTWDATKLTSYDWENGVDKHLPTLEPMVDWADVVVCHYIHSPGGLTIVQAIRDMKPCFMEIDDYFSQVPYYSLAYDDNKPGHAQDFWGTRQAIESTGIITSTGYLAGFYKQMNKNVVVMPNCVDFNIWDSFKSESHEKIRIGWIGGATHDGDLKLIKNVVYEVLEKYSQCELYVVSCPPPEWPKHERLILVNKWVTVDKYPKHLKQLSFDIGLCPLRDNYFNRGKSNLRYLEYSACSIPTVASEVEPYTHDFKGLLANDDEDWIRQISILVENKELRECMGRQSYLDVKNKFNLDNIAIDYSDFIKEQVKCHGQMYLGQQPYTVI